MNFFKKTWRWIDDRSGITDALKPLLGHPVPPDSRWLYVFGSATLFCFLLQVFTGVALALLYQPSSDNAYSSLLYIMDEAPLGKYLRGIHYFGASGMIVMMGLHLIRVYMMAAYKYPREMSWISGVVLLVLVVSMGFTGQLLRWDDNGVWSAIVAAEQIGRVPFIGKPLAHLLIGGETLGGKSLSRFFTYHVFLFPALLFATVGFHLYLVVRNGISEPPKRGRPVDPKTYRTWYNDMLKRVGVPFFPYAAWRDAVFGAATIVAVVILAAWLGAPPVEKPPDPSMVHATPRPDWYLLWVYALFALMPANIESYAIVFAPPLVLFGLFALPFVSNKGERSPLRRPWSIVGVVLVVTVVGTLLLVGNKAPWSPHFDAKLSGVNIPTQNTNALVGRTLFEQKACITCHTINGNGGITGPDLSHVAKRLNEEQMMVRIVNGSDNMPAYGRSLHGEELQQLVAFLKTLK